MNVCTRFVAIHRRHTGHLSATIEKIKFQNHLLVLKFQGSIQFFFTWTVTISLLPLHLHPGSQLAPQRQAGYTPLLMTAFDMLLESIYSEPGSNSAALRFCHVDTVMAAMSQREQDKEERQEG